MKIVDDLSIFQRSPAVRRSMSSSITDIGNVSVRLEHQYYPNEDFSGQVLFCPFLMLSENHSFFQQHRPIQSYLSLEYIYSGNLYIRNDNHGYVAEPGDLFLLHPGHSHDLLFDSSVPCKKLGLILYGPLLNYAISALHLDQVIYLHIEDSTRLEELFNKLRNTLLLGLTIRGKEENCALCLELLQMISNCCVTPPAEKIVTTFVDYVAAHCHEQLRVKDIIADYPMSLPSFNSLFEKTIGYTPYQYIIRTRMRRAEFLLKEGKMSIKEIAAAVGYNNQLHFSNEFHRLHNCSPSKYKT